MKNNIDDIVLLLKKIEDIAKRTVQIDERSDKVESKKMRLQQFLYTIDESKVTDIMVTKYNNLTISLKNMIDERNKLSTMWKKSKQTANDINLNSEELEKYYEKLNDFGETTVLMHKQIEEMLTKYKNEIETQIKILDSRESILQKEEKYILESEKLIGLK